MISKKCLKNSFAASIRAGVFKVHQRVIIFRKGYANFPHRLCPKVEPVGHTLGHALYFLSEKSLP